MAAGDEDMKKTDWAKTARATERAKINILQNYYMVGILGKFSVLTASYRRFPAQCKYSNFLPQKFMFRAFRRHPGFIRQNDGRL